MPDKIILTRPVFERLIEHLVYIEENMSSIADFYYPDLQEERENLISFLDFYVGKIDSVMKDIKVIEPDDGASAPNSFPFVIIGSLIMAEDSNGRTSQYRLTHPFEHGSRQKEISCLSPAGRSLIFRKAGDEFIMDGPSGSRRLKVNSIRLM